MANWHHAELHRDIDLMVEHHITKDDAARQQRTAAAILHRFENQPGVILADEVGMGKTFVALAVAVSVILGQRTKHQPVVVMTPTGLQKKWQGDFETFCDRCLPKLAKMKTDELKQRLVCLDDGEDLFHELDKSPEARPWIILITHGALNRKLKDEWIKLALMRRALMHQRDGAKLRRKVIKWASHFRGLKGHGTSAKSGEALWSLLLQTPSSGWRRVLVNEELRDESEGEPVPETLLDALKAEDFKELLRVICKLPERDTTTFADRLDKNKAELNDVLQNLWKLVLKRQRHRLPLLILDEAHHAKNAQTGLASLFENKVPKEEAEEIKRGAFAGKFERMLFLTATPFQLGHAELCEVLSRFQGVFQSSAKKARAEFEAEITTLSSALDASQDQAQLFERTWATHCPATLPAEAWRDIPEVQSVLVATQQRFDDAEKLLKKWVIRHTKPKTLSREFQHVSRRERWRGDAICDGSGEQGIEVTGDAVLPFLLAARAALMKPKSRPVFAEGLASSYEAFLHTREVKADTKGKKALHDGEERVDTVPVAKVDRATAWYLNRLEAALRLHDPASSAEHPKLAATVRRVIALWEQGEKVVVFCHFRKTGHKLRQMISHALRQRLFARHSEKDLGRLSRRFDDRKSPARMACDAAVRRLAAQYGLMAHEDLLQSVARRFLGTPAYLSRCLPAGVKQIDEATFSDAFEYRDGSGQSFQQVLVQFCAFLSRQCTPNKIQRILEALDSVQVGHGRVIELDTNELQGATCESVEPNVRLVNGTTGRETREKLMLTFNSPFFPEILITSSVMAEGVDLHLFCRHVIHHDLAWNPSTLEQRTGRLDRIGCKAEQSECGKPIQVYLPYLAATQDDTQFQVVTYRERWFGILMGEDYCADTLSTERIASRLPLPAEIVNRLRLDLRII